MRILVVEDEVDLNRVINRKLTKEGYSVDSCYDGREALDMIRFTEYDLVILDVMIPHIDGYEVVKKLRQRNNSVPVLFLTAKDSIEDRVKGLDSGGNDYLIKPFSFDELMARVRALLRSSNNITSSEIVVDDLVLDTNKKQVKRGNKEIILSKKEYQLLEYLMINKGIVISKDSILEHVWNFDYEGASNIVDVYINYLRNKIDKGYDKKLIHTQRGRGYTIKADNE